MDLAALTFDAARAFEGTTFRVELADRTVVPLTLDQVQSYETRPSRRSRTTPTAGTARRDPFSLYFLGPPSPLLPQAIYTLRSDAMTFETLFIVPVDQDGEGTEYEAVFT
jgi:hypothetical protein